MEIWLQIISELNKYEFIALSSTSRFFRTLSPPILFHTIRFAAIGDPPTTRRLLEMKTWASTGVLESIFEIKFTRTEFVVASREQPEVLAILHSMPRLQTVSLGIRSVSKANFLHILSHSSLNRLVLKGPWCANWKPKDPRLPRRCKLVHLVLHDVIPFLWVQEFLFEIAPQLEALEISLPRSKNPLYSPSLMLPISSKSQSLSDYAKSCPRLRSFTFHAPYFQGQTLDNNLYTFIFSHPKITYLSLLNVLHLSAGRHLPRLSLPNLIELAANLVPEDTTDLSPLFGNLSSVRKLRLQGIMGLGTSLRRLEGLLAKGCTGVEEMHLELDPDCNIENIFGVLARSSRQLRVLQLQISSRTEPIHGSGPLSNQVATEAWNPFRSFPKVDSSEAGPLGKPSSAATIPTLLHLTRVTVDVTIQDPDSKLIYTLILTWFNMFMRRACPALRILAVDAWQESWGEHQEMNAIQAAPSWWIKWWRAGDEDEWREERKDGKSERTGKSEGLPN